VSGMGHQNDETCSAEARTRKPNKNESDGSDGEDEGPMRRARRPSENKLNDADEEDGEDGADEASMRRARELACNHAGAALATAGASQLLFHRYTHTHTHLAHKTPPPP